jgi:2-polyprenyl-3-methyl-5-hydroxy-6-metoxy-1,4-benzoquinol methylase
MYSADGLTAPSVPRDLEQMLEGTQRLGCHSYGSKCSAGIVDLDYEQNPEVSELDMVSRIHTRFDMTGHVIPAAQRQMYTAIRSTFLSIVKSDPEFPERIWNPRVIDVGCGGGIGCNILSQEADFVWGIDKNERTIRYARQMFERVKNKAYWSPQVTFDVVDVTNEPRELAKFDVVVCIEVIEHIRDYRSLLSFLTRVGKPDAQYFISSPNRNAWIGTPKAKKPANPYHVREWTAAEFTAVLGEYFSHVDLFDQHMGAVVQDTTETPIMVRCTI